MDWITCTRPSECHKILTNGFYVATHVIRHACDFKSREKHNIVTDEHLLTTLKIKDNYKQVLRYGPAYFILVKTGLHLLCVSREDIKPSFSSQYLCLIGLTNKVWTAHSSVKAANENRPHARCSPIYIGCFTWLNWNCLSCSLFWTGFSFTLRISKSWIPTLVCALIGPKCTAKLLSAYLSNTK